MSVGDFVLYLQSIEQSYRHHVLAHFVNVEIRTTGITKIIHNIDIFIMMAIFSEGSSRTTASRARTR